MEARTGAKTTAQLRPRVLSALGSRNFAVLMAGRITSEMGRMMRVFARGWLVLELTGSAFLLGLVTSALSWPMLFIPFFGGALADRIDRRRLLLYTEFSLAVLWAVVSLAITLGLIQWWHLMITSFLSGVIQSFGRPGHEAMLGSVVDNQQLPSAVAINAAIQSWSGAVGLLLATVLFAIIGTAGVFWLTTFGQFTTAISLLLLRWKEQRVEAARQSVFSNLAEGFKYIRGQPVILGLVLVAAAASLFAGAYSFLLPVFARDILGVGAQGLGVLMTLNTTGVSIGAAVVMGLSNFPRRGLFLMVAAWGYAFLILGFSRSELFYLSLGLVFGMGLFATLSRTMVTMLLQLLAPNDLRGRVMSLQVTMMGLSWIGVLIMGALAEYLGAGNAVLVGGVVYGVIVSVIFARMHHLRSFR